MDSINESVLCVSKSKCSAIKSNISTGNAIRSAVCYVNRKPKSALQKRSKSRKKIVYHINLVVILHHRGLIYVRLWDSHNSHTSPEHCEIINFWWIKGSSISRPRWTRKNVAVSWLLAQPEGVLRELLIFHYCVCISLILILTLSLVVISLWSIIMNRYICSLECNIQNCVCPCVGLSRLLSDSL